MATIKGDGKSYDGGRFQVIAEGVTYTSNAIKFRIKPKILNDFNKSHQIKMQYTNAAGKWVTFGTTISVKEASTKFTAAKTLSVAAPKVQVRVVVGGVADTVTLESNVKPAKPSKVTAHFINNSRITINVYTGTKGPSVPNNTVQLYRKADMDSASWEAVGVPVSAQGNYKETVVVIHDDFDQPALGHRYKYGASTTNQAGSSGITYSSDWVYMAPSAASNVNASRIDDYHAQITFTINPAEINRKILTKARIVRWDNNAAPKAYRTVAIIPIVYNPEAIDTSLYTYIDDSVSPNNYYKYGVMTGNDSDGINRYVPDPEPITGTEPIYNTPGAPAHVSATYQQNTDVRVKIDNVNTNCSEKTVIERSIDGGTTWEEIAELDTAKALMTYTDVAVPISTSVLYRVKNGRDDTMWSEWRTMLQPVITLARPNKPSLITPLDKSKLLTNDTIILSWMHNPVDGTAQTRAEIEVTRNGEPSSSTYVVTGEETYYELDTSSYYPDDVITWSVRTRGQYAEWSPWSDNYEFRMIAAPEMVINAPTNNYQISTLPLHVDLDYIDYAGVLQDLQLILQQNGVEVYRESLDIGDTTQTRHQYDITGYMFENGQSYDMVITATSSTGFSVGATVSLTVQFEEVQFTRPWYPDVSVDNDTGIVTVTINPAEEPLEPDEEDETVYVDEKVVAATLYRNTMQGRVKVAESVLIERENEEDEVVGEQYVDYYAPLNQMYTYDLVMRSKTGKISVIQQENEVNTNYWYVYWGPNNSNICRAIWNPNGDVSLDRPEKELIRYSGREYPVSYDSTAMEETFSYSGIIIDREELNNFIAMIRNGGNGVWHSANGEAYDASFKFGYSADYTQRRIRWNCKLDVTRIEA